MYGKKCHRTKRNSTYTSLVRSARTRVKSNGKTAQERVPAGIYGGINTPPPDILAEPAGWVLLNSWYIHIRCISYLWRSYVAVTASQSHGVCPSPVPACNVVGTRSKMPWYLTFSFLARQAARGSMNNRSFGDANSELIKDASMSLRQRSRWLWE